MFCNICFESGDLIKPCDCSLSCHEICIKTWFNNVAYGKIVNEGNLCCPHCKAPGKAEFMQISKNDNEIINMLNVIKETKEWIHILCPSCKCLKKYMQESCSSRIEEKYSLVCDECSASTLKECPQCGIIIQKEGGCAHVKCICGAHFCWICLHIDNKQLIYNHIEIFHEKNTEYELRYAEYCHRLEENLITFAEIPHMMRTKELILIALRNNMCNLKNLTYADKDIYIEAIRKKKDQFKHVNEKNLSYSEYKEICMLAAEKNDDVLKHINHEYFTSNDYKEICLKVVKTYWLHMKYVKPEYLTREEYKEVCMSMIIPYGEVLHYIKDEYFDKETYKELVLIALKCGRDVFESLNDSRFSATEYKELCLLGVLSNEKSVSHIKCNRLNQEEYIELCMRSIDSNFSSIAHINIEHIGVSKFKELCFYAIDKNKKSLCKINNKIIHDDPKRTNLNSDDYVEICTHSIQKYPQTIKEVTINWINSLQYKQLCILALEKTSDPFKIFNKVHYRWLNFKDYREIELFAYKMYNGNK